jgi:transposase
MKTMTDKPTLAVALQQLVAMGLSSVDIAEFCEVSSGTVKSWIEGNGKPTGRNFLAALTLLRHKKISHADELTIAKEVIETGEILVLGLASTLEEVGKEVGIERNNNLMASLTGHKPVAEERKELFQRFVESRLPGYQAALAHNPILVKNHNGSESTVIVPLTSKQGEPSLVSKKEMMSVFHSSVTSGLIAAKHLTSDAYTAEDRQELRKLFPNRDLYDFSDLVTALLSESALKNVRNGGSH